MGIKDLVLKHPAQLRLHRYAVIDKLRECISDDDKVVREALYQLFKSEIFPGCTEICSSTRSSKATWEKHVPSLLPFIPKLTSKVTTGWQSRLLEAFTQTFRDCNRESLLKLACLSTIEEMLIHRGDMHHTEASDTVLLGYQTIWIRELPRFLILVGDNCSSSSQVVLRLVLRLGQFASSNSFLLWEYENIQFALIEFYSTCQEGPELEPFVLFYIIEVLHAAYKAGHIQIADHISFFMTLLSRFKVFPENIYPVRESDVKASNHGTLKSLACMVCSCLSQMGGSSIVFRLLEKSILDLIVS
ncbi:hypothetical protein REPUB_Repub02eG0209000 [Reevesia pubescens]